MKIVTVVGARPQFVKAAVVTRAFKKYPQIRELLIHTGQHFDQNMSQVFFDELSICRPHYHLEAGGGSHAENTARAMEGLEKILDLEKPDLVLVYGDTDSTLAGAITAAKGRIPLVHVEAGLRSFNRNMPEEVNRVIADHLAVLLFAPSAVAAKNLANEGITGRNVQVVGDVMYDAVKTYAEVAMARSTIIQRLKVVPGSYVLATIHRKDNTDDPSRLANILTGLADCGKPVLIPLHPRTRKRMSEHQIKLSPSIRIIDPLGYLDMLQLSRSAAVIATDSGGLQKEAYFHEIPCVVLREETEWSELVEVGAARLVGADSKQIAMAVSEMKRHDTLQAIYGKGNSSDLIAARIAQGDFARI